MPQSLSQVLVHVVFSTKHRAPLLDAAVAPRLHAYLATVARDHACEAMIVGGHRDHVHLLVRLGRTISQSDLLEALKKHSSRWMKEQGRDYAALYWQAGFGVFSFSPAHLAALTRYVRDQETHHGQETFQEKFRRLCKKYVLECDERYVWDRWNGPRRGRAG